MRTERHTVLPAACDRVSQQRVIPDRSRRARPSASSGISAWVAPTSRATLWAPPCSKSSGAESMAGAQSAVTRAGGRGHHVTPGPHAIRGHPERPPRRAVIGGMTIGHGTIPPRSPRTPARLRLASSPPPLPRIELGITKASRAGDCSGDRSCHPSHPLAWATVSVDPLVPTRQSYSCSSRSCMRRKQPPRYPHRSLRPPQAA